MISYKDLPLKLITIGIRHDRFFAIPSLSGSIMDKIVYDTKSPFNKDVFSATKPIIDGQGEMKGRILVAESENADERGDSLVIDIDSVVLTLRNVDVDKAIDSIRKVYLPYITKEIFKDFDISDVNRLGLVFSFKLPEDSQLVNSIVSKTTQGKFTHPEVFNLTFSEKSTEPLSYVLKDYYDYQNHIIFLRKNPEDNELRYDYQLYLRPSVKRISDLDLDGFLSSAKSNLDAKFISLLNSYES